MKIDIRDIDLVRDLLLVVNDLIINNPSYYRELNNKLTEILKKYKEEK